MKFFNVMALVLMSLVILTLVYRSQPAKILSISFISTSSHKITYEPLLYKLAQLGHQMTIVSPIKSTRKEIKNVRLFETIPLEEFQMNSVTPNFFEMKETDNSFSNLVNILFNPFLIMGNWIDKVCKKQFDSPIILELLQEHEQEKFDLVILTPLMNECLYGLVYKMNVTSILINQVPLLPWIGSNLGNPNLPSFIPSFSIPFSNPTNFQERFVNFINLIYTELLKSFLYNPLIERTYRDFFNDSSMPGIKEIEANASIVLCNSHVAFATHRPILPDIINVGGMQFKNPKPLTKDLDDFVSGGKYGFILFSMGSTLKGSTMPEKYRQIFLKAFAKLKQRVLWKWETETMEDLPQNVKLSKWLSQHDVLGHKNIRLFITHGGHGSTTEALYYGVPLIGIPIFGDQKFNLNQADKLGFALLLNFHELTVELLYDNINKVLYDPRYREKVKKLSHIHHDDIHHPLDRAAFHVEYVLRHQGARHLRSPARDLTVIQYYSIDVIAIVLSIVALILYIDFILIQMLLRKCRSRKEEKND